MGVRDRVSEYRLRMREAGYRPVQMWVPDVRTERFAAEAHRQSLVVATAKDDTQEFIEAVAASWDDE